ncbi:DUF3800 domain-containing protein [Umezawaea endophytica]|uniref:DUF3800 domain-containing protein n=1 Tax=Umezawaea endophytica TaxID=1654476 RepID=A0A9X2VX96_9PSEU|nr:DUF3800 domain-containing protein [Umezawaea endophytica]MCS7484656.1 DUF3800 domain-containing protein [Umezawaea endophytica]
MSEAEPAVIYVDESGNTGENLRDDAQPVFTFAGVRLSDERASELVGTVATKLRKSGPEELKSRSLLRNDRTQKILLDALQQLPAETAFTLVADKQYVTVSKLVDLLVVETMANSGYDMYLDGSARSLAHLYYYIGPVIGDAEAWQRLLVTFVDFAVGKEEVSPDRFFASIEAYLATVSLDEHDPFSMLGSIQLEGWKWWTSRRRGEFKDSLDPALAAFAVFSHEIGQRIGPFKLVCDESAVIQRHASFVLNVGEYPDLANPGTNLPSSPITELVFADSATSAQIQIADWIAATSRRYAATRLKDSKAKPVLPEFGELVESWMVWNIWPDSVEQFQADLGQGAGS